MSEQNGNNPLHEDFINSAPEELRDAAAELAPVWDQYVQGKFTEAAEFRKQYEPYQGLPLDQVTPEDIQDYLAFKDIQQDPQQLKAWHEQWDANLRSEHPELFDDGGEYGVGDPRLEAELRATQQQLRELSDWRSTQEQQANSQAAAAYVNEQIDSIKQDWPSLSDDDIDSICVLATKYVPNDGSKPPEDFIKQGFQDFQRIVGQTERNLFSQKEHQPTPAQHGGRPNTAPRPITDFDSANEAARRAILESIKAR
jgi:hypothetical protein